MSYEESVNTLIEDYIRVFKALHLGEVKEKREEEPDRGKSSKKRDSSAKKVKKEPALPKALDEGLKNIEFLMESRKASEHSVAEMH